MSARAATYSVTGMTASAAMAPTIYQNPYVTCSSMGVTY